MALIQTVNADNLYHMACKMGRGDQFGYKGWRALGEYLEELSEETGENVEVDIVGLCCEYSMAEDAEEVYEQYDYAHGGDLPTAEEWEELSDDYKIEVIEEFLEKKTSVVVCEDDLIIWQDF